MSEVFENDIEDLSALEDSAEEFPAGETVVYSEPLYCLKLEYSREGVYARVDKGTELPVNSFVIISTRYGKDLARVTGQTKKPLGIRPDDIVTVDRKATDADIKKAESLKLKEKDAFKIFQEKVREHGLDMKLITTHYLLDEPKVLFFFSSDKRVDFRELVKDLVAVFRMRIELRQIGVRDEARITGGLGVCGRPFCCHSISDKLRPVSIRMAKDQNLSLNSIKISGQCGRLLCCLSYEYDWYSEARRSLPPEGIHINYDGTNFRINTVNLLTSVIQMSGEDGRVIEIPASRFVRRDGKWAIN